MKRSIEEFGLTRAELIAALVEDSIGYLVPRSAELHIKEWERGEEVCFCERCLYVFQGNLYKCLAAATQSWGQLSRDRQQQLLSIVEQVSGLDATGQTMVGLLWPTWV